MKIGKLNTEDLQDIIFDNLKNNDSRVLATGEIGNDCSAIDLGKNIIYLTSDPITGSTTNLGKLIVNINCNDIATNGIKAIGIMLTILVPPNTEKNEINGIMKEVQEEADKIGITVLGGHTEVTNAVNRIVVSATAIGIGSKNDFKLKENVISGDRILITKGVGIEGTGIIAYEKEKELLEIFSETLIEDAKKNLDKISVVKDGVIANKYAKGMHDVTEGGILGAIWESSELYKMGVEIDYKKIFIQESTRKICEHFNIDPLKLISSGSMLIIVSEKNVNILIEELKKNGIESFDIGKFINSTEKVMIKYEKKIKILSPDSDELYKIL